MSFSENYQCEFIETPDEDLKCPICRDVALHPCFSSCCRKLFCHLCLLRSRSRPLPPCPHCRQPGYRFQPSEDRQATILSLHVRCPMKDKGCGWTGQLRDLTNSHLNAREGEEGGCPFVLITCSSGCGQQLPRRDLPRHRREECSKRPATCPRCHETGPHDSIVVGHAERVGGECPMFPIPCPNGCGRRELLRRDLEHHVSRECPQTPITCGYQGCAQEMTRGEAPAHDRENVQRHLALLASAMGGVASALREGESHAHQCQQQQLQLQCRVEWLYTRLSLVEQRIGDQLGPPIDFLMENYNRHSRHGNWWRSPTFRSHLGGYSMYLAVQIKSPPSGNNDGNPSSGSHADSGHVTMELRVNEDECNNHLAWPQWCLVRVEVLNQLGRQGHHTRTMRGELRRPVGVPSAWCCREDRFLTTLELGYDAHRHVQYLKDDCLVIRVAEVELCDYMYDA